MVTLAETSVAAANQLGLVHASDGFLVGQDVRNIALLFRTCPTEAACLLRLHPLPDAATTRAATC